MIQVWAKAPKLGASAIQGTWGIPSSEIKINQGTIELDGENVEEIERSKDADAEIRRLISFRERTEAVARHTKGETHHHNRKTNVRKETLRKTTAPDATHHVQQYSMGNHRETNHHEDEQQKLEKHHSHGYPLAIFPAVEMKQTAPIECPQRDAEQQEPDQHRLHQILRKASEEPSDALGIEQRAREGFRHRSRLQPRYQHQDALANQQSASQPCPQTGQLPINRYPIPHSPIPHDLSPPVTYSSSATRLSISRMRSSQALTTSRVAFTLLPLLPSGNSFCTSSFCRFSRLFTPKGIPRRPVICSLV